MADIENHGRRKDLDKEISSYISGIRKKRTGGVKRILKSIKGRKKKKSVELHPEVEAYGGAGKAKKEVPKKEVIEEVEDEQEFEQHEQQPAKKTFWQWLGEKFSAGPKPEEEYEKMEESEPEPVEPKEELTADDYEVEEDYAEEVKKEGFFSRLMGKIFVKTQEEEELEEASDELAEDFQDMKKIAEITTNVMKMLPKEKMHELKESEDFKAFKEILKKRNLIK